MNKHRKEMEEAKPQVPIVPMLDLTFQLLFFFITLFDPNVSQKIEGQMDLMLPAAAKDDKAKKDEKQAKDPELVDPFNKPEDPDLDIPAELTVVVNTQFDGSNNGAIAALFVEDRTGKPTPIDYDSKFTKLISYLKEEREASKNASIRVRGDSRLHWEAMIQVMDACRKAGFTDVGFMQPSDYNLAAP